MKKIILSLTLFLSLTIGTATASQGWPANYGGVMLQGFYWDSFIDTQWMYLESQSDELSRYFSLIWVPQSGYCGGGNNMGYTPMYYFRHDSSFGTEDQLRSMISTYKKKGTGIIADVVINHRNNMGVNGSWVDYPTEVYKGQTYRMTSTDICANDDAGQTKAWASKNGVSLSPNNDTGEDWNGCRDIDHKSANVQTCVKAYLKYLLEDLGYTGFRYDMVKGYSASYTGDYNHTVKPEFSVGEYWDGNASNVQRWMDGTKVDGQIQSGAFDFAFRYTCRDAANGNNWSKLGGVTSATSSTYNRYAVTFVENHDTEYRSASAAQDPLRKDTLACNAWLLANPGTPCVFYKHWMACKHDIKLMIEARHLVGITNQSAYVTMASSQEYCVRAVTGTNGKLLVVVGSNPDKCNVPQGYTKLLSGHHYRYYVSAECNTATWQQTVSRVEKEEQHHDFQPHTATVYVKPNFSPLYFYIWDSNNNTQLNGNWPGKEITATCQINGETWYYQTVDTKTYDYYFNIIFNQGSGKPQTSDIGHINSDRYFIATLSGSSISFQDVTSTVGIDRVITDPDDVDAQTGTPAPTAYDLQGRRLVRPAAGLYIMNGKKHIAR